MSAVSFDIEYVAERNKKTNALRIFYALPHLIITSALNYFGEALAVVQWLIILFTGKRNQAIWNLNRGVLDWQSRANAYAGLMYDTYPNFGFEKRDSQWHSPWVHRANRLTCVAHHLGGAAAAS
jgi:hypothetical protein